MWGLCVHLQALSGPWTAPEQPPPGHRFTLARQKIASPQQKKRLGGGFRFAHPPESWKLTQQGNTKGILIVLVFCKTEDSAARREALPVKWNTYQNCLSDTQVARTRASQLWQADSASEVHKSATPTWPINLWAYLNWNIQDQKSTFNHTYCKVEHRVDVTILCTCSNSHKNKAHQKVPVCFPKESPLPKFPLCKRKGDGGTQIQYQNPSITAH